MLRPPEKAADYENGSLRYPLADPAVISKLKHQYEEEG